VLGRAGRLTPGGLRAAITGSRPAATTPGSGCGTWPRSAIRPAPPRSAAGPPASATSGTTPPTKPADGPACATADPSAATTTGSNSTRSGRSISSPTAPSAGPPQPAAHTPPNPRGARSSRRGTTPAGELSLSGYGGQPGVGEALADVLFDRAQRGAAADAIQAAGSNGPSYSVTSRIPSGPTR
jgi:hypothetical protein